MLVLALIHLAVQNFCRATVCPERYRNISALQIESMDVKERPPGYATLVAAGFEKSWQGLAGSGYEVPKYWKYSDDEVEEILRARWDKA